MHKANSLKAFMKEFIRIHFYTETNKYQPSIRNCFFPCLVSIYPVNPQIPSLFLGPHLPILTLYVNAYFH